MPYFTSLTVLRFSTLRSHLEKYFVNSLLSRKFLKEIKLVFLQQIFREMKSTSHYFRMLLCQTLFHCILCPNIVFVEKFGLAVLQNHIRERILQFHLTITTYRYQCTFRKSHKYPKGFRQDNHHTITILVWLWDSKTKSYENSEHNNEYAKYSVKMPSFFCRKIWSLQYDKFACYDIP